MIKEYGFPMSGPRAVNDIVVIVVWFNPETGFVENIKSYLDEVGAVIVVDNSDADNAGLLSGLPGVSYCGLGENIGIAAALNKGCAMASDHGWRFAMTMDQDSHFAADQIRAHIVEAHRLMTDPAVSVVGPHYAEERPDPRVPKLEECDATITSGSILRLSAWEQIHGFNEALFIDGVDMDFCFRLRRAGKRIIVNHGAYIWHRLGDPILITAFGLKIRARNHGWIRKYYITRSLLYLRSEFKDFPRPYLLMIAVNFAKVVLMERDKKRRLCAMLAGAADHVRGRYGKWSPGRSFEPRK